MKFSEKEVIALLIFLVLISAFMTWGITSDIMFKEGAKTTRLYYEATHTFPASDWLEANEFKGFDCPQEILDTLKPY